MMFLAKMIRFSAYFTYIFSGHLSETSK